MPEETTPTTNDQPTFEEHVHPVGTILYSNRPGSIRSYRVDKLFHTIEGVAGYHLISSGGMATCIFSDDPVIAHSDRLWVDLP